ncbi:deoxyhypusine synthase-like [Amaranthus tricolor]|uniref:deoxyhypusine synthase-like n=1 Tax=Amaranthus tricolor TaxID=29722 RepID=UPI002590DECD|nr:deoxyhypusine synthase-like [Amaranthus tricolor]
MENDIMASVRSVVFKESENLEGKCIKIEGYDFNQGVNYPKLLKSFISTGFQASNLGEAIDVVNEMLNWRLANEIITEDCSEEEKDPVFRESVRCKVFLGFTSNLICLFSFLLRFNKHNICTQYFLFAHPQVDVAVTTAGGVEEDLVKCLAPTFKGDFSLPGAQLRSKLLNRIGNLLVPNENYCKFEDWIIPIFDKMLEEQTTEASILLLGFTLDAGFSEFSFCNLLASSIPCGFRFVVSMYAVRGKASSRRLIFGWPFNMLYENRKAHILKYIRVKILNKGKIMEDSTEIKVVSTQENVENASAANQETRDELLARHR